MTISVTRKIFLTSCAIVAISISANAQASENATHGENIIPSVSYSFDGMNGTYDKASLQRGLKVYREVCASCHGLKRVAFRNLSALGYNEDEIKAIAAEYTVVYGPNDDGEMFDRTARPSDHFKSPFANDKAAAAANGGAIPPDLSLITKARSGGADYVFGLLTGYTNAPENIHVAAGQYYNKSMVGNLIAMPPPLTDGAVEYTDGTPQTLEQYAKDVSNFLTWAAEPELEARHQMGIKVLLFLAIFAGLMYAVKRRIWKDVH